jgi:hypothetical protein
VIDVRNFIIKTDANYRDATVVGSYPKEYLKKCKKRKMLNITQGSWVLMKIISQQH